MLIWRRVPGTKKWVQIEYFPPDDERDQYVPVDPLLNCEAAAITLGLTLKALYPRAPFMASSEKHGSRWFFHRDTLLAIDAATERAMPSRREVLAGREARRRRGEGRRGGSHSAACDRRHGGRCHPAPQRIPSSEDGAAVTRSILDDLGK
ncbi:MAG: hypothetical protein JO197_09675 [Acidobacteria bacterium]|nr:hypothetical protein [Acidobacteriota bacterium]MBV9477365.1 hypothetical protein [Acidobacteriota bacterium]